MITINSIVNIVDADGYHVWEVQYQLRLGTEELVGSVLLRELSDEQTMINEIKNKLNL